MEVTSVEVVVIEILPLEVVFGGVIFVEVNPEKSLR